jgi:protein O-GlcNAc transferase
LSQLFQLDQVNLAAESDEAFVRIAVALSEDLDRLAELRNGLRSRMQRSALMDAARFARQVEGAYRSAWKALAERA